MPEPSWCSLYHDFTNLKARPPGIYKQDYLQELFYRYGDVDDTPAAPPMPDWCDGKPSVYTCMYYCVYFSMASYNML